MTDAPEPDRRFRRPARLDPQEADKIPGALAPELRAEVAHRTAAALVNEARATQDPEVAERLVRLVETEGLDVVAALWADAAPVTLPGALWRLYVLREWVRRDPATVSLRFTLGVAHAPVHEAIAGAAGMSPDDMHRLADAVLSGVFTGDLDVALERAAAFCRVLATGAAHDADGVDLTDADRAVRMTRGAASLLRTAEELEDGARLWRAGTLD